MRAALKQVFRPLYRAALGNPVARRLVQRELEALGATSWAAHAINEFVHGPCGAPHGLGERQKRDLVARFQRNTEHIESGTAAVVHVVLAREILSIPPEVKGDVVECGAWKGASSASLSLVCKAAGRRLKVCDSFEGLPDDGLKRHTGLHTGVYGYYKAGMFRGALDEVRENIERYGALEVCDFVQGFFNESLAALSGPVAFAFLDVDLEASTRDCLKALWPLLIENGAVYSDDAGDLDVVRVYFDDAWWREHLGCPAPGFVGSGCGLPLSPTFSSLGYTRKQGAFEEGDWRKVPFLYYPEGGDNGERQ